MERVYRFNESIRVILLFLLVFALKTGNQEGAVAVTSSIFRVSCLTLGSSHEGFFFCSFFLKGQLTLVLAAPVTCTSVTKVLPKMLSEMVNSALQEENTHIYV